MTGAPTYMAPDGPRWVPGAQVNDTQIDPRVAALAWETLSTLLEFANP